MKRIMIITVFLFSSLIVAQELNAVVTVNTEQLETLGRDNLEKFDKQIEDYLNNNKFTGDDWEGERIDCNFSIFFTSAGDNTYNGQVVITSQRPIYNSNSTSLMLKISDSNFSFNYEKNQTLYFSPTEFDALESFLNYYAYLIIGTDMDSYQPLGGTEYFTKASDIAVLGSNSAFSKGWALETSSYNKRGLTEDLLRSNFQQFRIDFYDYHYNGLDIINEDKKEAMNNVVKLVTNLDGIYSKISRMNVLMRVFFDTKHKELFSLLKDYPDKSVLRLLKKIDPSHISTYEQGLVD
ncbi:MAG: DUF4835 family protein [Ignavibacteriae bacterium]|nr:DUF4835 family protein [Ignavibacteriota bacterium]